MHFGFERSAGQNNKRPLPDETFYAHIKHTYICIAFGISVIRRTEYVVHVVQSATVTAPQFWSTILISVCIVSGYTFILNWSIMNRQSVSAACRAPTTCTRHSAATTTHINRICIWLVTLGSFIRQSKRLIPAVGRSRRIARILVAEMGFVHLCICIV